MPMSHHVHGGPSSSRKRRRIFTWHTIDTATDPASRYGGVETMFHIHVISASVHSIYLWPKARDANVGEVEGALAVDHCT